VFVDVAPERAAGLVERLRECGVLATGKARLRFVTHLDVDAAQVARAVDVIRAAV
jgi:threonine aldolase